MSSEVMLVDSITNVANVSGTTTIGNFSLFGILVTSLNGPFIFVFLILFIISLISYFLQKKDMAKQQQVLFFLLFALSLSAVFQNVTRISAEFAYFHPSKSIGDRINSGIKIIDRPMASVILFLEIIVMSFICYIFMETSRKTTYVSEETVSKGKIALYVILIGIATLLLVVNLIIVILHAVIAAGVIGAENSGQFQIAQIILFLAAPVCFLFSIISISIILNIFGRKLYVSLQTGKKKIKEMVIHNIKTVEMINYEETSDVTSTTTESSNTNNKGSNGSTIQAEMTKEQQQTYALKKRALRRAIALQIGLTASLILQFIGFCFIPIGYAWNYSLLFYHMFYNCGIVLFVGLLLTIYHPLKVVQKLFREPSNEKIKRKEN
ncbi:hypothetical protein ABK040_003444 [Willaertia magna]